MKYKAGDKFIIEIESILDEQVGLYKVKGYNTLVFDDNGLDRLEQVWDQKKDWCDGCKYEFLSPGEEPCDRCCYNYKPKFEPKPEEIQVGDEVEHEDGRKGVVVKVHKHTVIPLVFSSMNRIAIVLWPKDECTRTGKTYPELIKALEQLPKE